MSTNSSWFSRFHTLPLKRTLCGARVRCCGAFRSTGVRSSAHVAEQTSLPFAGWVRLRSTIGSDAVFPGKNFRSIQTPTECFDVVSIDKTKAPHAWIYLSSVPHTCSSPPFLTEGSWHCETKAIMILERWPEDRFIRT